MAFKHVYHSSQVQGLKVINPSQSTHEGSWVYATWDIVMSAAFLGTRGGDLTCSVGRDTESGKPYICERFEGAFALRYEGIQGSVYVLPSDGFVSGKTPWEEEVVCSEPVVPLREIRVENAQGFLLGLVVEGKLIVKFYPDKIDGIPEDDEDLVFRAVYWHKQQGDKVIERIKEYQPHLLDRVLRAIEENGQRTWRVTP